MEVEFVEGLNGVNLLVLEESDAAVIADLMMGGDGLKGQGELDDIRKSAVAEAMNQMMGSAATAMATMFRRSVKISPPGCSSIKLDKGDYPPPWPLEEKVMVRFKMVIGDLIDSYIVQVIPPEVARAQVALLTEGQGSHQEEAPAPDEGVSLPPKALPPPETGKVYGSARNIDLILDVPLEIEVILGSASKKIGEILNLSPGAVVELDRFIEEPVEICITGTPIARGEVVVVNENFGVRIIQILDPYERINRLKR